MNPPLGWTSPQAGVIHPAHAIGFKLSGAGHVELKSRISFE